ncbi:replication factor C subunit 1-like [Oppia nitens]|uniref:replication factor C subunit 1-like n=1 Tax=Oppia nitens TaxID=1686743 RepID=UPI0023DC1E37|nr:replication factor C subunit 1-like [Oppia nitens]
MQRYSNKQAGPWSSPIKPYNSDQKPLDISLRTCETAAQPPSPPPSAQTSARLRPLRCTYRQPGTSGQQSPNVTVVRNLHTRSKSTFRWRSAPDAGVEGSLQGLVFAITGSLDRLTDDDLTEMVETCGATLTQTMNADCNYLIVGTNGSTGAVDKATKAGKTVLNEAQFFHLVVNRGRQKHLQNRLATNDNDGHN